MPCQHSAKRSMSGYGHKLGLYTAQRDVPNWSIIAHKGPLGQLFQTCSGPWRGNLGSLPPYGTSCNDCYKPFTQPLERKVNRGRRLSSKKITQRACTAVLCVPQKNNCGATVCRPVVAVERVTVSFCYLLPLAGLRRRLGSFSILKTKYLARNDMAVNICSVTRKHPYE